MGRLGGIKAFGVKHAIAVTIRNLHLASLPAWLKTKAGIASLATFIIAPAGVLALSSQAGDNTKTATLAESSNSNATNQEASAAASTNLNQTTDNGSTQTSISVDEQTIDVPLNGSVHKVIETEGGTTTIDITTQNSTSGDAKVRSRNSLHFSTKSSSKIESSSSYHESSD